MEPEARGSRDRGNCNKEVQPELHKDPHDMRSAEAVQEPKSEAILSWSTSHHVWGSAEPCSSSGSSTPKWEEAEALFCEEEFLRKQLWFSHSIFDSSESEDSDSEVPKVKAEVKAKVDTAEADAEEGRREVHRKNVEDQPVLEDQPALEDNPALEEDCPLFRHGVTEDTATRAPSFQASESQGSAFDLHELGACRPCLYVESKMGCVNGASCNFCHFPHSKKERPRPCKAKRLQTKEMVSMLYKYFHHDSEEFKIASARLCRRSAYMRSILSVKAKAHAQTGSGSSSCEVGAMGVRGSAGCHGLPRAAESSNQSLSQRRTTSL